MRLLDRYIFIEWLKVFFLAMGAMIGLLLLEDVQDDLSDYLNWGASAWDILRYYAYLVPTFFPTIVPVSFLISLLFMLGNLHRNNEIVAMRASGLHLFRITRSLWLAAVALSGLLLYLTADYVPRAVEESRLLLDNLRFAHEAEIHESEENVGLIPFLSFDNRKEGRLWFMNRFSQYTNEGFGVNVYLRDSLWRETSRIMAREAYYDDVERHWVFVEGREISFLPDTGEQIRSLGFDRKVMADFTEDPALMMALEKDVEDLSFFEIKRLLDKITPEENPRIQSHAVRYHEILASPFSCIVIVALAIPFAVSGVRTNPMVGVIKAVGWFLVYFIVASISRMLGEQQVLPTVASAWLPLGMMLAYSCFLFKRVV